MSLRFSFIYDSCSVSGFGCANDWLAADVSSTYAHRQLQQRPWAAMWAACETPASEQCVSYYRSGTFALLRMYSSVTLDIDHLAQSIESYLIFKL